jgi:AcrR family transcriptional regulator
MSPKTKEQNEQIRQDKRKLILEKALEVFASKGYYNSSISLIAKNAGIAKGLIYDYFLSKEELLKSVVDEGFRDFFDLFPKNIDHELYRDLEPQIVFRNLLIKVFKIIKENINFWRLYMAIAVQPGVMELIIKDYEGIMFHQLDLLEQYYGLTGSVKPRADAMHAYILLDGIILNFIQPHKEFSPGELEELIWSLEKPVYK